MNKRQQLQLFHVLREKRIRDSRKSFWEFCKTMAGDFYIEGRTHLKTLCDTLQLIYEKKLINEKTGKPFRRLMINIPPRFGKSRTLVLFNQWVLGVNNENKIIAISYNDDMSSSFSRFTRDGIAETKTFPHEIVYSDIFPNTKIQQGNGGFQEWALDGKFFSFKGAGLGGSITGKGATITIVDDPIKNYEESLNERVLQRIHEFFTGTLMSRLEGDGMMIVNMTRWAKKDLCGVLLDGEEADEWFVLKLQAQKENGEMLCEELLPKEKLESFRKNMALGVYRANFFQEPVDEVGRLYGNIKVWDTLPQQFSQIACYIDTADTGEDALAGVLFGIKDGQGYILDMYFSKASMEKTEPEIADWLNKNFIQYKTPILARIESNNGGRGFARSVQRILSEKKIRGITIEWFTQTKNKKARILSNASFVMNNIFFPFGWNFKHKEFYEELMTYQREGKNKHDDTADVITGVAEYIVERFVNIGGFDRRKLGL